jgi:hypothetical protein
MAVHFDHSAISSVVYCDCGWRELTLTREGARRLAMAHEAGVHPGRRQVRDAARKFRARNVHTPEARSEDEP